MYLCMLWFWRIFFSIFLSFCVYGIFSYFCRVKRKLDPPCKYVYIYMYMYTYVYMYTYMYICICIHTYIFIHTYVCTHIYMHIYIYTYIHTHIHMYVCVYICVMLSLLYCSRVGKKTSTAMQNSEHQSYM